MDINEFWETVELIQETDSSTDKKAIIRSIISDHEESDWSAALAIIGGNKFDNIGVANRTIENAIEKSQLPYTADDIEGIRKEHGKMTSALVNEYPTPDASPSSTRNTLSDFTEDESTTTDAEYGSQEISQLYEDCVRISELSGNELVAEVAKLFEEYYPPAVSFALLGADISLDAGSKTIKAAVAEDTYSKTEIERARSFVPSVTEFIKLAQSDSLPTTVSTMSAFDPMLASRKELGEDRENWMAQLKLDGYRIVIHIKDGECKAYTRDKNDVTDSLPELQEVDWPDGEYVFDSEAMAFDDSLGNLPFTQTSQRIGRKHNLDQFDYDIRFHIFDLVVNDGEDITREPFKKRFAKLQSIIPTDNEFVSLVELYEDVDQLVEWAKQEGYEGVIAKDMEGPYQFGKYSTHWRKIKVTEETADLRITRFEKRQDDQLDYDVLGKIGVETKDGEFVGYIGTGFSDELAEQIWNNQEEYMGKIVEIQFEGFDEKLRFPSFKYFRDDGEADTLEKVKELGAEV